MGSTRTIAASIVFAAAALADPVVFNRDIRPLLSDRCLSCHGPDASNKGIRLRLDSEEAAKADLGGRFGIVPGKPEASQVITRLRSANKALRMPPAHTGAVVNEAEIARLEQWIREGAKWQRHWAFLPPEKSAVPAGVHPIDHFVRKRLAAEGLKPSPEADARTLARRVSFDISGLPPERKTADAFAANPNGAAYEKLVDELLASPHYAERMAIRWLDAARYADTNGYQTDAERVMWRWRDWVLDAFRLNMPYDRFVMEQIAGDLLPNAARSQHIATGFNRNHRGNSEGGIVPEEYLAEYAADRVETMSTVFLGLTVGCARCHNHKYDPISQKEYYQLFSYFDQIGEPGRYLKFGNSPPYVMAPTHDQETRQSAIQSELTAAEKKLKALDAQVVREQAAWEKGLAADARWTAKDRLDSALLERPVAFDGKRKQDAGDHARFGYQTKFTIGVRVKPTAGDGVVFHRMADDEANPAGYGVHLTGGRIQLMMAVRSLDDGLLVTSKKALPLNRWSHLTIRYDGSRTAAGVSLFVDGQPWELDVDLDLMNQEFQRQGRLVFGGGGAWKDRFQGELAEFRSYRRQLTDSEVAVLALAEPVGVLARKAEGSRKPVEAAALRAAYFDLGASVPVAAARSQVLTLRGRLEKLREEVPSVMVMREPEGRQPTHVLLRGAYDKPGAAVERGVLSALQPLPSGVPANRLGLAAWLIDRGNPLTARVFVNRVWQMAFGAGLVKTVEDFGAQGDWPSHPELLDWLAVDFMESGWDVKRLWKTIVTSETYRQSSRVTPVLRDKDPENRLLARGPRIRLSPEMIRDSALAASGLLVDRLGGPPVKPYQPAGLWSENGGADYKRDKGEGLYRRSLYTFWRRTTPPPFMAAFDSALRESCTVREGRTNTPLQALHLMNDEQFLEAARVLAERVLADGPKDINARAAGLTGRVLARAPREAELEAMRELLAYSLDRFRTKPADAEALLKQGDSPRSGSLDAVELAAWTNVASLVLNLDAAVTKE